MFFFSWFCWALFPIKKVTLCRLFAFESLKLIRKVKRKKATKKQNKINWRRLLLNVIVFIVEIKTQRIGEKEWANEERLMSKLGRAKDSRMNEHSSEKKMAKNLSFQWMYINLNIVVIIFALDEHIHALCTVYTRTHRLSMFICSKHKNLEQRLSNVNILAKNLLA